MLKKIRFVNINGRIYLRVNDVVELLNDFGSTEETDVRNRMNELISNLQEEAQDAQDMVRCNNET